MSRFGFCGASYTLQSPIADSEEIFNCYCEQPESVGATSAMTMMHSPGLSVAYTLVGENSVPKQFTVNGRTFVAGANFWELFQNATSNKIGPRSEERRVGKECRSR